MPGSGDGTRVMLLDRLHSEERGHWTSIRIELRSLTALGFRCTRVGKWFRAPVAVAVTDAISGTSDIEPRRRPHSPSDLAADTGETRYRVHGGGGVHTDLHWVSVAVGGRSGGSLS